MKVNVFDTGGLVVKEVVLNDAIWKIKPHRQAMYDAVISWRSSRRQGTHKVKTRSEVSGGGRKPWRQKGTGKARQGSIRAPQWRGGGVVFGPTTKKKYIKFINKKVRKLAIRSALSLKLIEKKLLIIDRLEMIKPSTKRMIFILNNLKINNEKVLVLTVNNDDILTKSLRNIKWVNVLPINRINVFDLLNADKLLIFEEAVRIIEEVYI